MMKCLILAAGKGSRLKPRGSPKPLVSLWGSTLIERQITAFKEGNINDFIIVNGYLGEEVKTCLDNSPVCRDVRITHVHNED